jgi:putative two-component system response regulator
MKVLIVDQNEASIETLHHVLVAEGFEVVSAQDGRTALKLIQEENCKLVISNSQLPGLSGIDLCRQVRAETTIGYVYFLLITGQQTAEETVQGLAAGADDFISRPVHPQEIVLRCRAGERILSLETRDVVIFALARLAESRDTETGAHLERVQHYCKLLASTLRAQGRFATQIDGEFIRLITETSPLHDIGKVGIPDNVLLKPGRLTHDEFEIMKTHTVIGAQTLQAALDKFPEAKFLRMARDIAASHHERYDGAGYPYNLSGEDIPLCGRIVAVADVYDAMTSKRVYKSAYSHETAVELIAEQSGQQFDPSVVAAFLQCATAFREIHNQLQPAESELRLEGVLANFEETRPKLIRSSQPIEEFDPPQFFPMPTAG